MWSCKFNKGEQDLIPFHQFREKDLEKMIEIVNSMNKNINYNILSEYQDFLLIYKDVSFRKIIYVLDSNTK